MNSALVRARLYVILAVLFGAMMSQAAPHPSIDIVASNWKFTPGTIVLHAGETTHLRFTSSEGVHGVESAELGIPKTTIAPGSFSEVDVTPKKAGTYRLHCSVICGAGHSDMVLIVEVKP